MFSYLSSFLTSRVSFPPSQTIGTVASIVLYINNIHGTAMLAVPIIFQQVRPGCNWRDLSPG